MKNMNWASMTTRIVVGAMVFYAAFAVVGSEAQARQRHKGQQEQKQSVAGDFAYYVLALSWSPSFCATQSVGAQPEQCGAGRRFSFVVHGLWPQYDKGWPQDCATSQPRAVSADLVFDSLDMMPSKKLIQHKWEKHGTCSGLNQTQYFEAARTAKDSIAIPEKYQAPTKYLMTSPMDLKRDFLAVNPQLDDSMIALTCKDRTLREVRICMDRNLTPRACGLNERRQCRSEKIVLPPVRGG